MNSRSELGLYLHVPFCDAKCPYCDFYSMRGSEERMEEYTNRMIAYIDSYGEKINRRADTLYFGGGTPSLLGGRRISALIAAARKNFALKNEEITVEVNPARDLNEFLEAVHAAGANRLSVGLQSAGEQELRLLGRRHTAAQAAQTVRSAQRAGFANISLDLMLAVPGQTRQSIAASVAFCAEAGVQHVSAYLLKIEPHTAFEKIQDTLALPGDDEAGDLYLFACEELEKYGFHQYEISNFAKSGDESRHNLKYWHCEEYLGIGPAAHSFVNGARFYYERNLRQFLAGCEPVQDGTGGDFEEYAMLAFRLAEGLTERGCRERFGFGVPEKMKKAALRFEKAGMVQMKNDSLRLTRKGFLVSNALIGELLESVNHG